jgi:hypothetical protein
MASRREPSLKVVEQNMCYGNPRIQGRPTAPEEQKMLTPKGWL